jgi:cell division initiation protein
MPLSPLDIKKKEFEQKMRGYDVDQVRAFLDEVSQEFELLLRDQYALEDELESNRKKLEHYLSLESMLEKTLLAAQQTAIKMEEQAKKEAALIIEETRLERDKVLKDFPLEIERARGEVIRLKAEYESTLVRMKSLIQGFNSFIDNISKAEQVEIS